jgi:cytochrome c-type biogenesis protein CcmH
MTGFVVSAALLTLIACVFVLWPLLARHGGASVAAEDREAQNLAAYRARLAELEAELAAGTIAPESYEGLETELAASLLADAETPDADAGTPAPAHSSRRARWPLLAAAALLPLVAVAGYVRYGAMPDVLLRDTAQVLLTGEGATESDMRALVQRIERRLVRTPDDADLWYLLGHGRLNLMDYRAAADAFDQLRRRVGDDPNVLISLAQAQFMADQGQVSEGNRALMHRILADRPTQPLVLEMLAIDAFNRHDYGAAAGYLERALSGPVSAGRAADLRAGLEQARALGGGVSAPPPAVTAQTNGVRIGVQVMLGDEVQASPGARVFVIARESGGPPMPIAVRALRLAELPAEFYLTDADAMQAGRTLSQFDRIELIARLSQTGDAAFREGDLEARSDPIDPRGDARVALTLGR